MTRTKDDEAMINDADEADDGATTTTRRATLTRAVAAAATALALDASTSPNPLRPRAASAASSSSPLAAGIDRVVLRTASITPDAAANALVETLGLRKLSAAEDPAAARDGRAVVTGAYGIALELRGGADGDDDDGGDGGDDGDVEKRIAASRFPPALTTLTLTSDNPARARNGAIRNGATAFKQPPHAGERCAGDAYLGCAVSVVGFPVVFARASAGGGQARSISAPVPVRPRRRGERRSLRTFSPGVRLSPPTPRFQSRNASAPFDSASDAPLTSAPTFRSLARNDPQAAVARVGVAAAAAGGVDAASVLAAFGGEVASGVRVLSGAQPGVVDRAAEDRKRDASARGETLAPDVPSGGGGVELGGEEKPSDAWRVLAMRSARGGWYVPP